MAKLSSRPLRPNPFHTYRDPETGKWLVVVSASENQYCPEGNSLISLDLTESALWPLEANSKL